jgi:hypothetical protein
MLPHYINLDAEQVSTTYRSQQYTSMMGKAVSKAYRGQHHTDKEGGDQL